MNQTTDRYEQLLNNMKNRFTVDNNGFDCTLGEYMLVKANAKKEQTALVVAKNAAVVAKSERAALALVSYVNDKLTIKAPPVKDKTIKAFPFRASASALLSAAVACAFVFSFCIIGAKLIGVSNNTASEVATVEYSEDYMPENQTEAAQANFN
jgi:hypothetical protein